jgi:FtsZ-binding cell division protein ZapB
LRSAEDKDKLRKELDAEVADLLSCVEDLRTLLVGTRDRITELETEREETRKEQWRLKKEVTTLTRLGKDYDELAAENERLRSHRDQAREGLKRLLGHTRALMSEFRP